ncbi:MAG: DUF885 domain-containing protein [Bryobacteraceae bacterium]
MRSLSSIAIPLSILIALGATLAGRSGEDQVRTLAENFVHASLALTSSTATSQGYHVHHGIRLDELLEDYSPTGINRARAFYQQSLSDLNQARGAHLTPEMNADLDVIKLQCEWSLLDLDKIQTYRHNPAFYVETIGNAIYSPFILNYAPEATRLSQVTTRIEKIPSFIDTAKRNLTSSPEIWTRVAEQENEGNFTLIDQTIRSKVPVDLKPRYDRAAAKALDSLKSFNAFLKNDLSRHRSDWRLGAENYAAKFKLTLAIGKTPQQTLADAEAKLESIRQDMKREAIAIYPKFFGKTAPPTDLNTVVSTVLDKVAQRHATRDTYFAEAKRDLAEATQFVKDHDLLALPSRSNLEVIPTPEFMRGIYGVGGFSAAPVFEPQLGAFYWITPFTADMTPERVESKLREYNFYGLKILTVHEAMPGHYVQFEYANDIQPKWRGALRTVYSNGPYVEGWAVYATQLMIDEGYEKTPEMQLTFGKQMLRVVANTILDVKLQTMGMTDQQALDLMIQDTFQEKEEAEKKLQRAKLSSCQLPTYFVGWRGWDQLREAYQEKEKSHLRLSEFHERALKEGAVPLPVLRGLLLR